MKSEENNWLIQDRVLVGISMAAVFLLPLVIVLGYLQVDLVSSILRDTMQVFLTTFLAYVITRHFAQKTAGDNLRNVQETARENLRDLGIASGRRILLLSAHMEELAEEIVNFRADGHLSPIYYKTVTTQLGRLAKEARLSVYDIQEMVKLDISIPALMDEVRTKIVDSAVREVVRCPNCSKQTEILLDETPSTRHVVCTTCRTLFTAHRLPGGEVKLGIPRAEFRSNVPHFVDCPNPNCSQRIRVNVRPNESGTIVRNCFECFARIKYILDERLVEGFEIESPLELPKREIKGNSGKCPYCSGVVFFKEKRNSRGEWIQYCPHCTKLIRVIESPEEEKTRRLNA